MLGFSARVPVLIALFVLSPRSALPDAGQVPPRTEGGQALVVPEDHLDLGEVYHVQPGVGTQFTWETDAALLRLVATCNRVVGYFVAPFEIEGDETPLLAGALRIPVASLSTGVERFDQELHGPGALNLAEHAELTFRVTHVREVQLVSNEDDRRRYTLKLNGELTLKDKATELELSGTLALLPFSFQMMRYSPGDLLILRASVDVKMADLGLPPPRAADADFRSEKATLKLYLLCSTVSPEKNFDPSIKREHHRKQLRFVTLVRDFKDPVQGYLFGRSFMKEIWEDGPALHRLAWATLTEEGLERRDLGFASEAAQRANELTEFKDPECLNTLARLHYERGDLQAALKWSRLAVEHLGDLPPYVAATIRAALQEYEVQSRPERE